MGIVHISGVIFGDDWFAYPEDIESGAVTTLESMKRELALASPSEDLRVTVNSYGGDTLAAAGMTIELEKWAASTGRGIVFEVGAIAASAAANMLVLTQGAKIAVHKVSEIMFHGCASFVVGGADALRDNARRMEQYNGNVIAALKEKTTLEDAEIESYFAEGREGWLNGASAIECGLADELTTGDGGEMPLAYKGAQGDSPDARLVAVAAFAARIKEKGTMAKKNMKAECGDPTKVNAEGEELTQEQLNERFGEKLEELEEKIEAQEEEIKALKAAKAEGGTPEEPKAEPTAEGEEPTQEQENEHLGEKIEELEKKLDDAEKKIKDLEAQNAKLTAGMRTNKQTAQGATAKDFAALVKEIPATLSPKEYVNRFEALKRDHAEAYKAYMEAHGKN